MEIQKRLDDSRMAYHIYNIHVVSAHNKCQIVLMAQISFY